MPRISRQQSNFKVDNPNVEVEISGTADWGIVEIYSLKRSYPPVALQLGVPRKLAIEPDAYSFDFHYMALGQDASIKARVTRLSDNVEKTKEQSASAGRPGLTSIYHEIEEV